MADLSGSLGIQPFEGMVTHLQEVKEQKAEFVKDSALSIFEPAGLSERLQFHHETGLLVDAIDAYTARADLVLVGKQGENVNFATEHLGSMLARVVRSASKPCFGNPRPV